MTPVQVAAAIHRGAVGEHEVLDAVVAVGSNQSGSVICVGELRKRHAGMRGVLDADDEVVAGLAPQCRTAAMPGPNTSVSVPPLRCCFDR